MSVHEAVPGSDYVSRLSPYLGILLTALVTVIVASVVGTTLLV